MVVDAGSRRGLLEEAGLGFTPFVPSLTICSPRDPDSRGNYDRFIPNRSAMDFDMARSLLCGSWKEKEITTMSPSAAAYQMLLKETLMKNSTRILSFKNKPAPPRPKGISDDGILHDVFPNKLVGERRRISPTIDATLYTPQLFDNYYWNLIDWGSTNLISIALASTVFLWGASDGPTTKLMAVGDDVGPITSVSWALDGRHIAIGLFSSDIQLWDVECKRQLRTLRGVHQSSVGSLEWDINNILTTGGADGRIVDNDVGVKYQIVQTYQGHQQEVCHLKRSHLGEQLASRGNDNHLHIWERNQSRPVHTFRDHTAAVKALAWCPFQSNLLASGGAGDEGHISFWNTKTGACLKSVNTGSQVRAMVWNKNKRELLSAHGFPRKQLTLWKYPSMNKLSELGDHESEFIFMTQSPDGCRVASAGNALLDLWNVFPEVPKPASDRANGGLFTNFPSIR